MLLFLEVEVWFYCGSLVLLWRFGFWGWGGGVIHRVAGAGPRGVDLSGSGGDVKILAGVAAFISIFYIGWFCLIRWVGVGGAEAAACLAAPLLSPESINECLHGLDGKPNNVTIQKSIWQKYFPVDAKRR